MFGDSIPIIHWTYTLEPGRYPSLMIRHEQQPRRQLLPGVVLAIDTDCHHRCLKRETVVAVSSVSGDLNIATLSSSAL